MELVRTVQLPNNTERGDFWRPGDRFKYWIWCPVRFPHLIAESQFTHVSTRLCILQPSALTAEVSAMWRHGAMCPARSTVFQLHNECKCTHPPNVMSPYCNNSPEHALQLEYWGCGPRPSLPPVLTIAAYLQPAAVSQSHCTRSPVNYCNGSPLISDIIHVTFNPLCIPNTIPQRF